MSKDVYEANEHVNQKSIESFIHENGGIFLKNEIVSSRLYDTLLNLLSNVESGCSSAVVSSGYGLLLTQADLKNRILRSELKRCKEENEELERNNKTLIEHNKKILNEYKKMKDLFDPGQNTTSNSTLNEIDDLKNRIQLLNVQKDIEKNRFSEIIQRKQTKIEQYKTDIEELRKDIANVNNSLISSRNLLRKELGVQERDSIKVMISEFRSNYDIEDDGVTLKQYFDNQVDKVETLNAIISNFKLDPQNVIEELNNKFIKIFSSKNNRSSSPKYIYQTPPSHSLEEEPDEVDLYVANTALLLHLPETTTRETLIDVINQRERSLEAKYVDKIKKLKEQMNTLGKKLEDKYKEQICNLEKVINSEKDNCNNQYNSNLQLSETNKELNNTINSLKLELSKLKTGLSDKEEENKSLKHQANLAKEEIEKYREGKEVQSEKENQLLERINDLENRLDTSNKKLIKSESELTTIKLLYEQISLERDELKITSEDFMKKFSEKSADTSSSSDDLLTALDLVSRHLIDQIGEFEEESVKRVTICSMLRKQSELLKSMDCQFEELRKRAKDFEVKFLLVREEKENILNSQAILEDVLHATSTLKLNKLYSQFHKAAVEIENEETNSIEKLRKVASLLTRAVVELTDKTELNSNQRLMDQNQRLLSFLDDTQSFIYFLSQNGRFVFHNAASRENFESTYSSFSINDADKKNIIKEKADEISVFLAENSALCREENYILQFLDCDADPLKMAETVSKIVDSYQDLSKADPRELFCALSQSVAVNFVLKKYAQNITEQNIVTTISLKNTIAEHEMIRQETAKKQEDKISRLQEDLDIEIDRRATAEEGIENTLGVLRTYLISDAENSNIKAIMSSIDAAKKFVIEPQNYNQDLEEKFLALSEELTRTREELDASKEESLRELRDAREASAFVEAEASKTIKENMRVIQDLENKIIVIEEEKKNAINKCDNQREELEALKDKLFKTEELVEHTKKKMTYEMKQLEEQLVLKFKRREMILSENERSKREILRDEIKSIKADLTRARDSLVEKDTIINSLEEFKARMFSEQRQKSAKSRESVLQTTEVINELKALLRNANTKIHSYQIENKLLNARIKSIEERNSKEKVNYEAQLAVRTMTIEANAEEKSSKVKRELETELQQFLIDVCHLFKDFADFSRPISRESVSQLLKRVSDSIRRENNSEMADIREVLNIPKAASIKTHVLDVYKKVKYLTKINEDWRSWALEQTKKGPDTNDVDLRNEIDVLISENM